MKVIGINGSPRKNWNTSILLESALKGTGAKGAETEMIYLYDLDFKGCYSCFACKRNGGKNYGKCAINDDLKIVLEKIYKADSLILGTPIYFRSMSGEMRSFLERLLFQHLIYSSPPSSTFDGKLNVGIIYTMNITGEQFKEGELKPHLERTESSIRLIFGNVSTFYGFDTYQIDDYSGVEYKYLNADKKREKRDNEFPNDCEKAFEFGSKLAVK
jgi:multimeric flavodoxin WrbA